MVTDPIRIVPLHPRPEAAPAIPANLTYRGGPLLSSVEVFTAFWRAASLAAEAPLMKQMNDFFLYGVASPLIDPLREDSVPGISIGHGSLAGTTIIPDRPTSST